MDIVDAFVVKLGLDPRDYQREIKNYRDDRKRLSQEDRRYNQEQEDAQKRMTQGFRQLRNEAVGFLTVLAGANTVRQFAANILEGDAATGRFAANMGLATSRVGAWEEAIKRAGGSAQEGRALIGQMAQAFQSLQLTGTTGNDADFQGLGVTARDLQNPETALLRIAEAGQRMPRAEFTARLQRIGVSEAGITLLSKGRRELENYVNTMEAQGVATEKSAQDAIAFDNALNDIEQTLKGKARPAVAGFAEVVANLAKNQDVVNGLTYTAIGLIGAAGVTAAIAYAPFLALAGAIAAVASAFMDANTNARDWAQTAKFFDQLRNGDLAGAASTFGESASDTISEWMGKAGVNPNARFGGKTWGEWQNDARWRGVDPFEFGGVRSPGAGPSRGGTARTGGNGSDIVAFFKSRGYTTEQARGITAGIIAESGGDHTARNRSSGAYGLGQHLSANRRANFRKRYGIDITQSTRAQQLDFIDWELKGGDAGGAAVRAQTTAGGTLNAYIRSFMRPAAGAETMGDLRRGNAWLSGHGGGSAMTTSQTTNIGQITVYSAATDAEGIARDMRGAIGRRGLVTQAGSGLTG